MPRYVEKPLIAKVHVVDANGDPVTGATVSVKVLDPAGQDWDGTWSADYYSDGVYYAEITPDEVGDWTFIFTCSNPKFSKALVYNVVHDTTVWKQYTNQIRQVGPPIQNTWYTLCDLEGNLRLEYLSLVQQNTETVSKDIEWEITDDVSTFSGSFGGLEHLFYAFFTLQHQHLYGVSGSTNCIIPFANSGYEDIDAVQTPIYVSFVECRRFRFRFRITSAPGTNQYLTATLTLSAKGDVTDNLD